jgi:hydroxymethylglutaryl-CoA lyase
MLRHPRACARPLASVIASSIRHASLARHQQIYAFTAASDVVKIVEVGPRDGLQNERTALAAGIKATLIDRLSALGLSCVESGSFVGLKWVPQVSTAALRHSVISSITDVGAEMAGTADVLTAIAPRKGVSYPVLVPNAHGLHVFLALRREGPELAAGLDEVAVFTAASDAFSRTNTNVSVGESLAKLEGVVAGARKVGLRVRGYVSVVVECPYGGRVARARSAARSGTWAATRSVSATPSGAARPMTSARSLPRSQRTSPSACSRATQVGP